MKLPFTQVDAFADRPFTGNSAAVMPLDAWLPDETLVKIAMENNLSETAFLVPTAGDSDFELRWFSPATEIPLCGHATLAAGHVVLAADSSKESVNFATRKAGMLKVMRAGEGYVLDLPATLMEPAEDEALLDVLELPGAPVFAARGGIERIHIVLLSDEAAVRAVTPDFRRLAGIDTMAIVTAPGDSADIASRVFVSAWGIDEDPVTGSAHAALVPFWAERLGRTQFTAFQASSRGGHMLCRLKGDRVILEARCFTVIEGVFSL